MGAEGKKAGSSPNSFLSTNHHRKRRRGSCGAERGGRRVRLQHRRTPEMHPHTATDAVGGVRGKIPIFSFFLFFSFFTRRRRRCCLRLAPPPSLLLFPSSSPPRAHGGGVCSLSAPFSKAPLLPARFILLPPSSRLMLHSHLRQNNTAQPGQEGSGYSGLNADRTIAFFVLTLVYFHNNR